MSRLPIRLRLTVICVVAIAAVLALIGAFLFFRTKQAIDDSISQSLHSRLGALRAYAEAGSRPRIPPGERFAQIVTPDGRVVVNRPVGLHRLLRPAEAQQASTGVHLFELHERERYLAGPATVGGRRYVVVAGASLAEHERALEGLGGALFIGAPLALLLVGGVAYLVAGAALRPVEAMRERAASISTADSTAQLPVPEVDDELRRLSVTLNAMLRRIAGSAEHERRFITNASHELRTPLAALRAELELADRSTSSTPELRDAVRHSREDVERLISLSDSLLELAVAEEGHALSIGSVDVDDVLQAAAAQSRRAEVARDREIVVDPSGLEVQADEIALRRALTNLFDNALIHGTGRVTAGAAPSGDGTRVELWVENEGRVDASVADGGAFDRFGRGADAAGRPRAGLGLSLVRTIAVQHCGDARLEQVGADRVRAVIALPAG